jgi:polysaccharide pyruvyl transferase WcaK-like protein
MNVGDLALGYTVESVAQAVSRKPALQVLGGGFLGLHKWPQSDCVVVAGGAVGREDIIQTLRDKCADQPRALAIEGISFWSVDSLSDSSLAFLNSVKSITCRNSRDAQRLRHLGVRKAQHVQDNAFLLAGDDHIVESTELPLKRTLALNVVSQHMKRKGKSYVSSGYDRVSHNFGKAYKKTIRGITKAHLDRGWNVKHTPFTPDDEMYAKYIFNGLNVELQSFSPDPMKVIKSISSSYKMIGSRFHAHVFSFICDTPFLSLSYAPKCRLLWQDLGLSRETQATQAEIATTPTDVADRFSNLAGSRLSRTRLQSIASRRSESLRQTIRAILFA